MMKNDYKFFEEESQKYKDALLNYKNKSQIFCDCNFHPNCSIPEPALKVNLRDKPIVWKRIDDLYPAPLFNKDLINPDYIQQGALGDCYFMTALMRVASQPHLVEPLFERNLPDSIFGKVPNSINIKCGAVVIYFRAFGRKTPVLIDTLIPTLNGTPIFSSLINNSKSAWSLLVEKAYAKLNGSYSNIDGNFFFQSIYSLYGYYNKSILFFDKNSTAKNSLIAKILKHHSRGCVADASINKISDDHEAELMNKHNLYTGHSYLISKIRKYNNTYFFLLYNPHGKNIWKGDYDKDSKLLTPELKKCLKTDPEGGHFWMIEDDFFEHFNEVDVSKPIDPRFTVRLFQCKLFQLAGSSYENLPNFCFQLVSSKKVPSKRLHFHLLIEKRSKNFSQAQSMSSLCVCYSNSNGKKITRAPSKILRSSKLFQIYNFSIEFDGYDQTTFIIYKEDKPDIEEECYVRVFCKHDFKLINIDHPEKPFPSCQNLGAAFDNFSVSAPSQVRKIQKIANYNPAFWYSGSFYIDNSIEDQIAEEFKGIDMNHYSFQSEQIDLRTFIFNEEEIRLRKKYSCYVINHKRSGKEYVAYVRRHPISIVSDNFSEELSIHRTIKYPSILSLEGYNEANFDYEPYPVLILEYCRRETLSDILSLEKERNLHKKGCSKWNNTKKMINLIGIAYGMNHLHSKSIIHRNLNCENVFLDDNLYPKIGEFDSSKLVSSKLDSAPLNGPTYMYAPEYINDENGSYSFPVDVFAYAMLFYHVISNEVPMIPHANNFDLFNKIISGQRPRLDIIDQKYHDFLSSCWNKDQNLRPSFTNIIDLLENKKDLWLDGVDEKEIKQYIRQFKS